MNKKILGLETRTRLDSRDVSADIIRIIAVFSVVSVHFFLNNGFYSETVKGSDMLIMCFMRTLFGVCVPLFLMLTGYLMNKKTLSLKYYAGIKTTLITYLLASFACVIFRATFFNVKFTLKSIVLDLLDYTAAPYSWYVEMYIGLFILIPFLNLIYNNLKDKKQKQALVITMFCLTALPTMFNIFSFNDAAWWANPASSKEYDALLPDFWLSTYPIAFYFTGCYIKEFGSKLKTKTLLGLLVLSVLIFGAFNFYRSHGTTYITGLYGYWYGVQPYVLTVLLFTLLTRIKGNKLPYLGKYALWKIANLSLCTYLVSYIFDQIFYPILKAKVPVMTDRWPYYFIIVPVVFLCSTALSAVIMLVKFAAENVIKDLKRLFIFIKSKINISNQSLLFIILLVASVIFAFWKCKFGFGGNDEAFYLTTAHRITLGDIFINDEWHLSQLSGFLLLPLVALFKLITGSTEGIILTFRVLYIIAHAGVTILIYRKLKQYGYITVVASILYFIFTPYDIMALSYNTMAIELLVVTGILLATSDSNKKLPFIISGLAFAGAVLCSPYLAIVYILFAVCVLLNFILKKVKFTTTIFSEDTFSIKTFKWFSLGVGILAFVFIIFVFTRLSISDIVANLPGMFTDPEHPPIPFARKFTSYFRHIYQCHPYFKIAVVSFGIMLLAMIFDKNRQNHRSFYLITSCLITLFSYFLFVPMLTSKYYNAIMFPMIFVGITSYILCKKKPRKLMISLFILGLLYGFCVSYGSNQYFYVVSMASVITNIASFIFTGTLLKELYKKHDNVAFGKTLKYLSVAAISVIVIMLGFLQIKVKYTHCFWESTVTTELKSQIKNGPAKGIYTTVSNSSTYEKIYADLKYYETQNPDNILILSKRTWCYLNMNDFPYGTLSAWLPESVPSLQRLITYYEVNPDKVPKYIYIPKDSDWDAITIVNEAISRGYYLDENEVSYKLTR